MKTLLKYFLLFPLLLSVAFGQLERGTRRVLGSPGLSRAGSVQTLTTAQFFVVGDSKSGTSKNWPGIIHTLDSNYTSIGLNLAASGWTPANVRDSVDAHLLKVDAVPYFVIINIGINSLAVSRDSNVSQMGYVADKCYAQWPFAKIFFMRPWASTVSASACDSMAAFIATVVSTRSYCFLGPDERVWLKGEDDGASETSDGIHYSDYGDTLCAQQWISIFNATTKSRFLEAIPLSADNVTYNQIRFKGTVNPMYSSATVRALWGTTSGTYTDSTSVASNPPTNDARDTVTYTKTGLSESTTYYYRIAASSSLGYVRSNQKSASTVVAPISFNRADSTLGIWNHASPNAVTAPIDSGVNAYTILGFVGTQTVDSVIVDGTGGGKMDSLVSYAPSTVFARAYGRKSLQSGTRTFTIYSTGGNVTAAIAVLTLFGVNQSTPTGATAANYKTTTTDPSLSISNSSGNWVVDVIGSVSVTQVYTPTSGQTVRARNKIDEQTNYLVTMSTTEVDNSLITYTKSESGTSVHVAVVINKAP